MDEILTGNAFPMSTSGNFQEIYTDSNGSVCNGLPGYRSKRRRLDDSTEMTSDTVFSRGRTFLPVRKGSDVYSTENWKVSGTSLFVPLAADVYINVSKYEQVTVTQGSFHTADDNGTFKGSLMGHVVHFWRYDKHQRRNFISLSILLTNSQDFHSVVAFLQNV